MSLKRVCNLSYIVKIIIQIDSLGLAKSIPLEFDATITPQLESAMSNALKTELAKTDRAGQTKLWELFVKGNMKDILTSSLNNVSNFKFTEIENSQIIDWKDAIESIESVPPIDAIIPDPTQNFRDFSLKFVLNSKYSCGSGLTFFIRNLGSAK